MFDVKDYFLWDGIKNKDTLKVLVRAKKVFEMLSHNFPVEIEPGRYICVDDLGRISVCQERHVTTIDKGSHSEKDEVVTIPFEYMSQFLYEINNISEETFADTLANYALNCITRDNK